MIPIILNKGFIAYISEEDANAVCNKMWWSKTYKNGSTYAVCKINGKEVKMHRFILGVTDPKEEVDHEDGNGLNNTRPNMRVVTKAQNQMNRFKTSGTSAYKGVSWNPRDGYWEATIGYDRKHIRIGAFDNEHEAAHAYNLKAAELFGEYANINKLVGELPKESSLRTRNKYSYWLQGPKVHKEDSNLSRLVSTANWLFYTKDKYPTVLYNINKYGKYSIDLWEITREAKKDHH